MAVKIAGYLPVYGTLVVDSELSEFYASLRSVNQSHINGLAASATTPITTSIPAVPRDRGFFRFHWFHDLLMSPPAHLEMLRFHGFASCYLPAVRPPHASALTSPEIPYGPLAFHPAGLICCCYDGRRFSRSRYHHRLSRPLETQRNKWHNCS